MMIAFNIDNAASSTVVIRRNHFNALFIIFYQQLVYKGKYFIDNFGNDRDNYEYNRICENISLYLRRCNNI